MTVTLRSRAAINGVDAASGGRVPGGDYYPPAAPGSVTITTSQAVTLPNGVETFHLDVYGPGGSGNGAASGSGTIAGTGGGGGGFAKCDIGGGLWTQGSALQVTIGDAGVPTGVRNGGTTKVAVGVTTLAQATGGHGPDTRAGGVGTVTVGAGITNGSTSAGTAGSVSGSSLVGGAGGKAGGSGGAGGAGGVGTVGSPGVAPGGGGGGGANVGGDILVGGVGGAGRVVISWPA